MNPDADIYSLALDYLAAGRFVFLRLEQVQDEDLISIYFIPNPRPTHGLRGLFDVDPNVRRYSTVCAAKLLVDALG